LPLQLRRLRSLRLPFFQTRPAPKSAAGHPKWFTLPSGRRLHADFTLHDHRIGPCSCPAPASRRRRSETALRHPGPALQQELGWTKRDLKTQLLLRVRHPRWPALLPAGSHAVLVFAIVLTIGDGTGPARHLSPRRFHPARSPSGDSIISSASSPSSSNFMRLIQNILPTPTSRLPAHPITDDSWLGETCVCPNHLSQSECDLGRSDAVYYYQQLTGRPEWVNLMNHAPSGKSDRAGRPSHRQEIENLLGWTVGLPPNAPVAAVDSHLFPRPTTASFWPGHHPAFVELDQKFKRSVAQALSTRFWPAACAWRQGRDGRFREDIGVGRIMGKSVF